MSGSVRGVKLFYKAEYCGTPQSKERRNREYKVCLNDRALRLLDQDVTRKSGCFSAHENGAVSGILCTLERGLYADSTGLRISEFLRLFFCPVLAEYATVFPSGSENRSPYPTKCSAKSNPVQTSYCTHDLFFV